MTEPDKFDDIRPYYDSEVPEAMQRIAQSEYLPQLSQFVFPDKTIEEVRNTIRNIKTTDEFQYKVMLYAQQHIIKRTITNLTVEGLDYLDREKNYLFVSNHRDIMLDSSLFQYTLHTHGFRTTEITFGSNLMHPQLVVDIGKSNKMFKVERGGDIRRMLYNSQHLSEYMRYTITQKGESIWIAQRNGRTKNGKDATNQGIIKMFCLSRPKDLPHSIAELNIVPLSISYQIEPCDFLKTRELYLSRNGQKYTKQPGEDLNSILTGILQQKGNVHLSICKPIEYDELLFEYKNPNEFYKTVASMIDKRIYEKYKLYDNNYIAFDLQNNSNIYKSKYTEESKKVFVERINKMLQQTDGNNDILTEIFLEIYANPITQCTINNAQLTMHN